ncbi:hypothetical protein H8959_019475 [Pygathrix nigripes]
MSLGRLLRRASSKASDLLTLTPGGSGSGSPCVLDGEIIYSKNNVCVHPPEGLQGLGEHHPGYLCLYMEKDEMLGATLILAWVPNSRIQRQDEEALRYITPESSPVRKAPHPRGRRTRSSGASHQPSPTELRPTLTPKDEDILVVAQSIPDGVLASPAPEDEEKLAQGLGVDGAQPASRPARSPSGILSTVSPQDVTEEGRELRPEAGEEDGSLELSAEGVSRDSSFDSDSDAFSSPFCLSPISTALAESRSSVFLESDSSRSAPQGVQPEYLDSLVATLAGVRVGSMPCGEFPGLWNLETFLSGERCMVPQGSSWPWAQRTEMRLSGKSPVSENKLESVHSVGQDPLLGSILAGAPMEGLGGVTWPRKSLLGLWIPSAFPAIPFLPNPPGKPEADEKLLEVGKEVSGGTRIRMRFALPISVPGCSSCPANRSPEQERGGHKAGDEEGSGRQEWREGHVRGSRVGDSKERGKE